jgi:hypothetical protein
VQRYLWRVQYLYPDATTAYEPVCVRADTEAAARAEVESATERHRRATNATRVLTLTLVTAD